jgi:hypothetical protein
MKLVVGKTLKIPCMQAGLCGYDDEGHKETVLLSNEALQYMAETAYGIPVVIWHKKVDSENIENVTVGRVADMHFVDNVWYAHFVVDDQEAVDKLQSGWGVSTSYAVEESGPGGTLNNVPYDREIKKAKYLHLAIVEHPRYEIAKNPVFYNSMEKENMLGKFWKSFKKEFSGEEAKQCAVMVNGIKRSLDELTSEMDKMENSIELVLEGNDEIEYKGQKITVSALVEKYNSMKKKNEVEDKEKEDKEKKENEEKEAKEKKENEEKEKAKKEADEKENARKAEEKKNFDELENAKNKGENQSKKDDSQFQSVREKVEAGRKAYGSSK